MVSFTSFRLEVGDIMTCYTLLVITNFEMVPSYEPKRTYQFVLDLFVSACHMARHLDNQQFSKLNLIQLVFHPQEHLMQEDVSSSSSMGHGSRRSPSTVTELKQSSGYSSSLSTKQSKDSVASVTHLQTRRSALIGLLWPSLFKKISPQGICEFSFGDTKY